MTAYERSREERIKSNLEKMKKLGISDLSLNFKSLTSLPKSSKRPSTKHGASSPLLPPLHHQPRRRSSRLQTATPVSYSEAVMSKKSGPIEDQYVMLEEGAKLEVYTEEHEKLLGSTEKSWTLFVDGYGKDGKRIYDPIKGKTCHQCRQKTLGHRTHCSQCEMVQGQFCGDCLYMRYGEHVLEAIENPNWICPPCRGICNCSLCRNGKGWAPTGVLYKRIASLGYKSVAHYLIQTQRAQNKEEKNSVTINQATAKRSLPFSEMETPIHDELKMETPIHDELESNEEKEMPKSTTVAAGKESELKFKVEEEKEVDDYDNSKITVEKCTKPKRKRALVFEPSPERESIGARLRQRHLQIDEKSCEVKQPVNNMTTNDGISVLKSNRILEKKTECDSEPNLDSISGRLRQRRRMNKE
ncbi:Zinc-finger domain of monoamine-oxidase A repressor R1 [Euphorbia peplus]|nr:Zinc-finger domain of monoamine-oxidase A repressor R1 [Euphorbia peplus]